MYHNQFFYYPFFIQQAVFSFLDDQMRILNTSEEYNQLENFSSSPIQCFPDDYRAPEDEVNRILAMLKVQDNQFISELQPIVDNYFWTAISFTLDNASSYMGNVNQKTNAIYNAFTKSYPEIFSALRTLGIPENIINSTFRGIIEFTHRNSNIPPAQTPPPFPSNI